MSEKTVSPPCISVFSIRKRAMAVVLMLGLTACSSLGLESEKTYDTNDRDNIYKNGSLASESGGFDILGSSEKKKENNGIGVNGFLWRAALDTISFMPIASADPFGGLITTDWYAAPATPNERVKLNVFILDRELRADGVKVTVFRQVRATDQEWADAPASANTATSLEDTILTRARQLRLAQKEFK